MLRYEECDVLSEIHAIGLGFFQQDGHSHFQFRRLDGNREAPAEARDQTVFDTGHFLWITVAGNDDLFVRLDECIEGVKKLLLCTIFTVEELYVVDEE